jgi:hypothetical protein
MMRPPPPYAVRITHDKPNYGFWGPAEPLTSEQLADALEWARRLSDLWYRCQELARLAPSISEPRPRTKVLREAFAAAWELPEPNRLVTVAAWPLRALLDLGETDWFGREVGRLLPVILPEPNPFRRQDGIAALLFADAPEVWRSRVLEHYIEACAETQKTLTMARVAEYINRVDHAAAVRVARLIGVPRRRRLTLERIGAAD